MYTASLGHPIQMGFNGAPRTVYEGASWSGLLNFVEEPLALEDFNLSFHQPATGSSCAPPLPPPRDSYLRALPDMMPSPSASPPGDHLSGGSAQTPSKKRGSRVCFQCNITFNSSSELHRHERTNLLHKKERGYKCDGCTNTYTRGDNLQRHKDKFHKLS
jgi:hypothetical protein